MIKALAVTKEEATNVRRHSTRLHRATPGIGLTDAQRRAVAHAFGYKVALELDYPLRVVVVAHGNASEIGARVVELEDKLDPATSELDPADEF